MQVKEKWLEALKSHTESASCSNDKCLVFEPCDEVSGLKDFGLVLGSAADIAFDVSDRIAETFNINRRGPHEVIYREWRGMYFRLPFESYMINGDRLHGGEADTCVLTITGYLPDSEETVILGQPFLNNYYVVLDQDLEVPRIGLAAMKGAFAEISEWPLNDAWLSPAVVTLLILALISIAGCFAWPLIKKHLERGKFFDSHNEVYYERATSIQHEKPDHIDVSPTEVKKIRAEITIDLGKKEV